MFATRLAIDWIAPFTGLAANRPAFAALIALCVGAAALAAPLLAILILAALAAHALMRVDVRLDLAGLAGPSFAALLVGALAGISSAVGVLFVWRVFEDARWSIRQAQRLAHAAGRPAETSKRALLHAWMTPLYGLTIVAYTAPHMVAGLPLDLPHLPGWTAILSGVLAGLALFDWALRRAADWRLGELAPAPAMHLLTHHVVFLAAFGLAIDVSAGIVTLMAWRLAHAAPLARSA